MHAERDHLVRFVFPRLREELLERRIHFVDVDLRWGVTSDQDTLQICREIIDECRPRFLGILGGRYGWIPPGRERSITAEEIHYAVLDRLGARRYAYFYFRDPKATASMAEETPGEYREPPDCASGRKLAELKDAIIRAGLSVRVYPAEWDDRQSRLVGLQMFGDLVYADLIASILDQFGTEPPASVDRLTDENELMEAFVEERVERYVVGSRRPILRKMIDFAWAEGRPNILLIRGRPGWGKSALLARFYRELADAQLPPRESPTLVIPHFVGASAGSADLRRTLWRFCRLLADAAGVTEPPPEDRHELVAKFENLLTLVAATVRVIFIVDALNQFDLQDDAASLHWLPRELPSDVRVITSTVIRAAGETMSSEVDSNIQNAGKLRDQVEVLVLAPLTRNDRKTVVREFLTRFGKRMSSDQLSLLLDKRESGKPLYLRAVLEELRTLGTYEEITDLIRMFPDDTRQLFSWILTSRLASDPGFRDQAGNSVGPEVVRRFAALLGASRQGLTQMELVELVDPGDPLGNVAALQRLLRPYLMRRGELLDFYHGQFRDAVVGKYLDEEDKRSTVHETLADFFRLKADPAADATWGDDAPRALRELPYHTAHAKLHDALFALARDGAFLRAQDRAFPEDPYLSPNTIEAALNAAALVDDPGKIAEFTLGHAKRLLATARQSPIDALLEGNLERAEELIKLEAIERKRRIQWRLLLAWTLKDQGRREEARRMLDRLANDGVSTLSISNGATLAIRALAEIGGTCIDIAESLACRILLNEDILALCHRLCQKGRRIRPSMYFHRRERECQMDALLETATAEAAAEDLWLALRLAQRISRKDARVEALAEISVAQEAIRDTAGAFRTAGRAVAVTRGPFPNEWDRAKALLTIAAAQAALGSWRGALRAFVRAVDTVHSSLGSGLPPGSAFGKITRKLAEAGHRREVLRVLARQRGRAQTKEGLAVISAGQAAAGDTDEAQRTYARAVETSDRRASGWFVERWLAEALREITMARARSANFVLAVGTAERIGDRETRAKVLTEIAAVQVAGGDSAAARRTVTQALECIEDRSTRSEVLREIGGAQAAAGDSVGARQAFTMALEEARGIEPGMSRHWAVLEVGGAAARARESEVARSAFVKALEDAQGFPLLLRAIPLQLVAEALATAGDALGAQRTFAESLQTGWSNEEWQERAHALQEIAEVQLAVRDPDGAQQTIAGALDAARSIGDDMRRAEALRAIAALQVAAGDAEGARRALVSAVEATQSNRFDPEGMLQQIAVLQVTVGDLDNARRTFAAALEAATEIALYSFHNDETETTPATIVGAQAEAGDFVGALEAAQSIGNQSLTASGIGTIALVMAEGGNPLGARELFARAVKVAQRIKDRKEKALLFEALARAQAHVGDAEAARASFARALKAARQIEELETQTEALAVIAEGLAESGDLTGAQRVLAEAYEVAQRANETGLAAEPEEALLAIAREQLRLGDFTQALNTAKRLEDSEMQVEALRETAIGLAQNGDIKRARQVFKGALRASYRIDDQYSRDEAFREISKAQARLMDISRALDTARRIKDWGRQAFSFGEIATICAGTGDLAAARRIFTQALDAAERIEDRHSKSSVLREIGTAQAAAGDSEGARRLLVRALEASQSIEDRNARHRAVAEIATALTRAGFVDAACGGLREILVPCSHYLNEAYRVCALLATLYPNQAGAVAVAVLKSNAVELSRSETTGSWNPYSQGEPQEAGQSGARRKF